MNLDHWQQHEPILLQFEQSWEDGHIPSISDVLDSVDVPDIKSLAIELVLIDVEHRLRRGEAVAVEDYSSRMLSLWTPEIQDELNAQMRGTRERLAGEATSVGKSASADSTIVDSTTEKMQCTKLDSKKIGNDKLSGLQLGPLQVEEKIGSGAFASVYAANDTQLKRRVAIKFLNSEHCTPADRIRLRREAQAVASLDHPNLLRVYSTGVFESTDYIVSELIDGNTLHDILSESEFSIDQAVSLVKEIVAGVSSAHLAGIIHRDIKPANIMVQDGHPKLVDFGLASIAGAQQELTQIGDVLGTPAFMSPEQAAGKGHCADARSDIYSIGAVLYRLVCGRLPFEGSTTEVLQQVVNSQPVAPGAHKKGVSRDLQTLIVKCLEKDPVDRYQSADALAADLQAIQRNEPISARPIGLITRSLRWSRNHPVASAGSIAIVLLLVFLAGVGSQLSSVIRERNRAQQAEDATQQLLAESSADAGRLALQRGAFEEAIKYLNLGISQGHRRPGDLLQDKIESLLNLGEVDEASELLTDSSSLQQIEDFQGKQALWLAELSLAKGATTAEVIEMLQAAEGYSQSNGQQAYLNALQANATKPALAQLSVLLDEQPFHYRGRLQKCLLTFLLADFEGADEELSLALQVFPADQNLMILQALCAAARNEQQQAQDLLRSASLSDEDLVSWNHFVIWLHETMFESQLESEMGRTDIKMVADTLQQFSSDFLPLIRSRRWCIPPKIQEKFRLLIDGLTVDSEGNLAEDSRLLNSLTAVHPEGTLFLVEAGLLLSELSGEASAIEEVEKLKEAQAAFASGMEAPGFLVQSDQLAQKGMFLTSMMLALVHKVNPEDNRQRYLAASKRVLVESIQTTSSARAFSIASLNAGDLDEAERWVRRWLKLANATEKELDAKWHLAIVHQQRGQWLSVKATAEEILEMKPGHTPAIGLKEQAINALKSALDVQ